MGRCCWEGNVVHSIDLWGEGWSIHLNQPRDNRSLDHGCSIPSPHSNFASVHRPEHVLRDLGGQDLGNRPKEKREEQVPSTKDACLVGPLWPQSLLTIHSTPFQGRSINCDNPIPPGQPYDLWHVLLHLWAPGNPRV